MFATAVESVPDAAVVVITSPGRRSGVTVSQHDPPGWLTVTRPSPRPGVESIAGTFVAVPMTTPLREAATFTSSPSWKPLACTKSRW